MSTPIPDCGVCSTRHISKVSDIWCSDCGEGLCIDCKEHHGASNSTRHHVTIPIKEYKKLPVFILNIKEICEKHNEKYQMFCKSHDCPCCKKCTIENHKECKDVVLIEDIIQNVKTSVSFDDLQQQLSVISKNIHRIQENRQVNVELIRKQTERIEKDIRDLREKMNNHLDKLQEKLTSELMHVEVKTNNGIQELLTTLQRMEEEIYKSQDNIENIKKYASELQAFLALMQIQGISMKTENYIQSLVEEDNFKDIKLSFKADDQICNLLNKVNSFGNISIERESSEIEIEAYKQNQAQQRVVSIPVRSANDVMLKLKHRIKTDRRYITGCCILSNGKMVFVDYHPGEVIVLHKDGSMDFTIDIRSEKPNDVTCIDSNTIAVSVKYSDNKVRVIDLKKRSITNKINTKSTVYGITYNDRSLICCAEDKGLIRIDLKDNSITPVVRWSLPHWSFVTTNGNNIYYTDRTHKVTCCDVNGKVQWELYDTNVLVSPRGITTDNNNNVYVVGQGSNNVVVISPDGQNYRVLLSDRDGVKQPWGIHCDRASNQLLLTNDGDNTFLLYDISTTSP